MVALLEKSENRELLRYNGDRARIEAELQMLESHPGYDLRVLEPLERVPGSWSCLLEIFRLGTPGPFCVVCGATVEEDGEFIKGFFYCVDCAPHDYDSDEGVK